MLLQLLITLQFTHSESRSKILFKGKEVFPAISLNAMHSRTKAKVENETQRTKKREKVAKAFDKMLINMLPFQL